MVERPINRLRKKIEKENLWLFILSSLEKNKRYGKELRRIIKEKFGFLIGTMTAYKVLYLLKKGGFVVSKKHGKTVFYEITDKGAKELEKGKKLLKKYSKMI